nr:hypothetical protein pGA45_127 [uncultured bacterium]
MSGCQNGFIESINGCFRDECLNEQWFGDVSHARKIINDWAYVSPK